MKINLNSKNNLIYPKSKKTGNKKMIVELTKLKAIIYVEERTRGSPLASTKTSLPSLTCTFIKFSRLPGWHKNLNELRACEKQSKKKTGKCKNIHVASMPAIYHKWRHLTIFSFSRPYRHIKQYCQHVAHTLKLSSYKIIIPIL